MCRAAHPPVAGPRRRHRERDRSPRRAGDARLAEARRDRERHGGGPTGHQFEFQLSATGAVSRTAVETIPATSFRARPGHRRAVADSESTGTAADGDTCSITRADGSDSSVDPRLYALSYNAMIPPTGNVALARDDVESNPSSVAASAADARVTIRFTGRCTATHTYAQPSDPACSPTFTADAP